MARHLLQNGYTGTSYGYFTPPAGAAGPASYVVGYDYSCLMKDIRKTNCQTMPVSVWSVMTCVTAIVMIILVICIPVSFIIRSGQCAGRGLKFWAKGGRQFPEYEEFEKRAAKTSGDMPMPPKVSQFRQGWGPTYTNQDRHSEDSDW